MNSQLFRCQKGLLRLGLGAAVLPLLSPAGLAQAPLPEVSPQVPAQTLPAQTLPAQTFPTQAPGLPVPPQNLPAGVRGNQPGVCLVSPQGVGANAAIFSTRPVFVWNGPSISRIELTDRGTGQVAWSARPEVPVPQVAYNSTPLNPGGEYRWTLYGLDGALLGSADFRVMTVEQRAQVEAALSSLTARLNEEGRTPTEINLAVVEYLNSQGLWSDAITTSINASPASPALGRYVRTTRNRICDNLIGG